MRNDRRASLRGVSTVRKILLAALLFVLGYVTMQVTRCDARADGAAVER
jgi:hypothetical protein